MKLPISNQAALMLMRKATEEGVPYSLVQVNPAAGPFQLGLDSDSWAGANIRITLHASGAWEAVLNNYMTPGGST